MINDYALALLEIGLGLLLGLLVLGIYRMRFECYRVSKSRSGPGIVENVTFLQFYLRSNHFRTTLNQCNGQKFIWACTS